MHCSQVQFISLLVGKLASLVFAVKLFQSKGISLLMTRWILAKKAKDWHKNVVVSTVNKTQLVGTSSGEIIVPTYDWADYLGQYFKKVKSITKYHHFHIDINKPGKVYVRETAVQEMQHVSNMIDLLDTNVMPPTILPKGLSNERQWYLYDKMREYCPDNCKDKTCPLPEVPRFHRNIPEELPETEDVVTEPRQKQPRVCGNCHLPGHNLSM